MQQKINIKNYKSDGFIKNYQKLIQDVVIPYQYEILNDNIEGIEKSNAIANFVNAGKRIRGEEAEDFYGMVFQDSDVAKWIEAAAYSLSLTPDEALEKEIDDVIDIVEAAQDTDGYLNTYYTIKDKDKRWTNLLEGHELYCSGHMMEAAVAYYEATGKDKLLHVMLKNVNCIYRYFITEGHEGYPGHPEVELALMRMYHATKDKQCLELAEHFIDVRGVDPYFYEKERQNREWSVWGSDGKNHAYQQSDKPVRELTEATGHSVRAVYLYTGMAKLAQVTQEEALKDACKKLWENIVERRMYVTGGIGSTVLGEAFTTDYNLPNDTAYAETCASIGLMFMASEMLALETKGEYADIMERAFYNTVLAGMQLDGKRFFYVNPLEVIPGISGVIATHAHDLPQRPTWYACACCPPNVARLITSFGQYAYGENENTAFCHMFAEGTVTFDNGMSLKCTTKYPYDFTIEYEVLEGGKTLAVRIPDYCNGFTLTMNGESCDYVSKDGYAYIEQVQTGSKIVLVLDVEVQKIFCSPKVADNTGSVAIQRGPLVYCVEGVDNKGDVLSLSILRDNEFKVEWDETLFGGVAKIVTEGVKTIQGEHLYSSKRPLEEKVVLTAVPYYTWGNRGENEMRVWIPEKGI